MRTTGDVINDGDDEVDNVTNTGANFQRANIHSLGQAIRAMATSADLPQVGQQLPDMISSLQIQLNQEIFNKRLPLIGEAMRDTSNAGTQFLSTISSTIGTLPTSSESSMLDALNSRLGTTFNPCSG